MASGWVYADPVSIFCSPTRTVKYYEVTVQVVLVKSGALYFICKIASPFSCDKSNKIRLFQNSCKIEYQLRKYGPSRSLCLNNFRKVKSGTFEFQSTCVLRERFVISFHDYLV